jgi:hypothetical protein
MVRTTGGRKASRILREWSKVLGRVPPAIVGRDGSAFGMNSLVSLRGRCPGVSFQLEERSEKLLRQGYGGRRQG